MYWSGDLLDIGAGLSDDELAEVEELKIRIKLPTPRILEFTTPQGFTSAHSKGGATITYTSNDQMSERIVSHSQRSFSDLYRYFSKTATRDCALRSAGTRRLHSKVGSTDRGQSLGIQSRRSRWNRSLQQRSRVCPFSPLPSRSH